jgi:hypothetical protein
MKKIVLVALTLFIAGTTFADKKCCKDKESCSHKTEAKACSKGAEGKSCCQKKGGEAKAAVNDDGTVSTAHKCAKGAEGKSCCQKKATSDATPAQEAKPNSAR